MSYGRWNSPTTWARIYLYRFYSSFSYRVRDLIRKNKKCFSWSFFTQFFSYQTNFHETLLWKNVLFHLKNCPFLSRFHCPGFKLNLPIKIPNMANSLFSTMFSAKILALSVKMLFFLNIFSFWSVFSGLYKQVLVHGQIRRQRTLVW